jgi:sulfate adenylyltransferase subunit 1 (EFTu-like GTPase family)
MVTGASVSDIAIVLVDARHGVVEQTRRHVSIAALLGVSHLILAVNKMDLVEWSESAFDEVVTDVAEILTTLESSVPLHAIPICATDGQNVVEKSAEASWYEGPSVIDLLETLDVAPVPTVGARLAVQWTLREHGGSDYRGYAGRLEGGVLRVGDAVTVHPKGNTSVVTGLTRAGSPTEIAVPGDAIAIELADDLDVGKFDVIVASAAVQPLDATNIIVDVCWLVDTELKVGDSLIVRHPSGEAHGKVARILHRLDLDTLKNSSTDTLVLNDIARVVIQLKTPLVVDAYNSNRAGGSAIAIDPVTNATIGALMVVGQEGDQPLASTKRASSYATSPKKGVRGFVKDFFTLKVNEEF